MSILLLFLAAGETEVDTFPKKFQKMNHTDNVVVN